MKAYLSASRLLWPSPLERTLCSSASSSCRSSCIDFPDCSARSLYGRSDVRLIPSLRSISLNGVPFANSRMITLKSVIVAFLFAISLWFLFSYHKGTCSTQSNPSVVCLTTGTCSSASGGTFENATDGTFHSATAGTFVSAMPGTFDSATGGTFNPLLSTSISRWAATG